MALSMILVFAKLAPLHVLYTIFAFLWNTGQRLIASTILMFLKSSKQDFVLCFNIVYRKKINELDPASPWNFLWIYNGYAPLSSMASNKNIQQYCFGEKWVYFVETDSNVQTHSSEISPFLFVAQFNHAKKMYVLTHAQFNELASSVGKPEVKVVLLSSTGRCGSTLISQMMESTSATLSLSEPDSLTSLKEIHSAKQLSNSQVRTLLRSIFLLYAHQATFYDAKITFIKTHSICYPLIPLIHQEIPWVKHICMYRQGLATIQSQIQAFGSTVIMQAMSKSTESLREMLQVMPVDFYGSIDDITDVFSLTARMWIGLLSDIKDYIVQQNIPIRGLKYEDLLASPKGYLRIINDEFSLGLNEDEIHSGVLATKKDSQRGLTISREAVNEKSDKKEARNEIKGKFSGQVKTELGEVCAKLGIPTLDSQDRLLGTIDPAEVKAYMNKIK